MVSTYSNIAGAPGIGIYPLVNAQTNVGAGDAEDAAHFQSILDKLAAQAKQAQAQTATQSSNTPAKNFAMTKASGWTQPSSSAATTADASSATASGSGTHSFKNFMKNMWDVVNPLQHIPVVSAIYRHATGDTISDGAHFAGDALYGGVIGGAISMADIAFKKATGNDVGETVIASMTGKGSNASSDTMIAQNNLPQITPASGGQTVTASASAPRAVAGKQIIWSDNSGSSQNGNSLVASASTSPLFPPSGTIGGGSASPSTPAQPTLPANSAASTGAVQTQEAPAGTARTAASPELIASRMMDGLQKYAQMQQDMNPQLSGLY